MNEVYVVTYWDDDKPVVTVFNNLENAEKCFEYFKSCHTGACIDECPVCSTFSD